MAYSRAVSSWFDSRRGMALAMVMAGGAVGAMVLPPMTEALIGSIGWRSACAAIGVVVLAVGLPTVAKFVRERPAPLRLAGARSGQAADSGTRKRAFCSL